MKLTARFPNFGQAYDAVRMRELVRHLEALFNQVTVDVRRGAYSVGETVTLGAEDDIVLVDTSAGDVEIVLPEISDAMVRERREFEVVKTQAANVVTVTPSGADTICNELDALLISQWTALRFRATTGNWVVI